MAAGSEESHRAGLKIDEEIIASIRQFWDVMVDASARTSGQTGGLQEVNREAYGQLHLRVSKALSQEEWMDMVEGKNIANTDWVEDIAAFSGQGTASVWFDEMRIKFNQAVSKIPGGWAELFMRYDDDDSGELDFEEFVNSVRKDCDMAQEVVSDVDLRAIFSKVDADQSGTITADEFDRLIMEPGVGSKSTGGGKAITMSFEIFFASMFELAEVWATQLTKKPIVNFLNQLFARVTVDTRAVPGQTRKDAGIQLRDIVTKETGLGASAKHLYQLDTEQEAKMAAAFVPAPAVVAVVAPEPEPELELESEPEPAPAPEPEPEPETEPEPTPDTSAEDEAAELRRQAALRAAERERLRLEAEEAERLRILEEGRLRREAGACTINRPLITMHD